MSAIAGLVHLDGRPCDPAAVQKLADALARRAPGGTSIWTEGSAGLVHGLIVTTPESATERQPVVDAGAGLAITFDGRLDNRAELSRLLDVRVVDAGAIGDAELILRAYRVFGDAVVDHLLGDFAFAIWETPRRRLFCARDAMGIKPFCYRVDRHSIAWASDIGVLAAAAGPMPAPNEGMVGEYLAGVITDKRETLFRDIFRLPPAHLLTADARGIAVRAYWRPDPSVSFGTGATRSTSNSSPTWCTAPSPHACARAGRSASCSAAASTPPRSPASPRSCGGKAPCRAPASRRSPSACRDQTMNVRSSIRWPIGGSCPRTAPRSDRRRKASFATRLPGTSTS